jgi:hypothetical protein
VLEHVADPEAALERVRSWLRPGGSVIVAVPNLDSLQARLGQNRWFHQDVPRHCTHFTARGLGLLLERSGFTLERIRHLLVEHNFLGMWQTLLNRVCRERDFAFRLLKHDLPGVPRRVVALDLAVTLLAGAVLAPIAIALELLAGLSGHGGTVFAVASVGLEQ